MPYEVNDLCHAPEAESFAECMGVTDMPDVDEEDEAVDLFVGKVERLINALPKSKDIELAIMANNMGGTQFHHEFCQCDPSVGVSPCPYCAIDAVLIRLWRIVDPAAAEKARP